MVIMRSNPYESRAQTGWEAANEICNLDALERISDTWHEYDHVLDKSIVPLMQVMPSQPRVIIGPSHSKHGAIPS